MACDLKPIGMGATSCTESYAGTGTTAYLFFSEDVDTTDLKISETKPEYESFALKTGKKIYPIRLKKQANKVVGTGLGDNKGFSNVATIVIDKDIENLSVVERTVQNKACGLLLAKPGVNAGAWCLWNPTVDTKFEFNTDTGDSYDADSGSTWTVTSAPCAYDSIGISNAVFAALEVAEGSSATDPENTSGSGS